MDLTVLSKSLILLKIQVKAIVKNHGYQIEVNCHKNMAFIHKNLLSKSFS